MSCIWTGSFLEIQVNPAAYVKHSIILAGNHVTIELGDKELFVYPKTVPYHKFLTKDTGYLFYCNSPKYGTGSPINVFF